MKSKFNFIACLLSFLTITLLFSCDSDSSSGSVSTGWYSRESFPTLSKFDAIKNDIDKGYLKKTSLFSTDGSWINYNSSKYGTIPTTISVFKIESSNTIIYYFTTLRKTSSSSFGTKIYPIITSSDKDYYETIGTLSYYGSPTYYTYYKDGNKLYVTNGDIFTITSTGLIKDGSSAKYTKFTPKK